MKSFNSKILVNFSAFLALILCCASAQAVSITWKTVNDVNVVPDAAPGGNNPGGTASFGAVNYQYRISATEVTNSQYVEFLNAVAPLGGNPYGVYNNLMSFDPDHSVGGINYNIGNANGSKFTVQTGQGNNPVTYVNYWDAVRFTNWLANGQAGGSTQSGSYSLSGSSEVPDNASTVVRNPGASIFLPNENEWYKAAYHIPNTDTYYNYATSSDLLPGSDPPAGGSNSANFWESVSETYATTGAGPFENAAINYLTDVGAYTNSLSPYGTFDQTGNVSEWTEASAAFSTAGLKGTWGGNWDSFANSEMAASFRAGLSPSVDSYRLGFRVASLIPNVDPPGPGSGGGIPEPSTLLISAVGLLALARKRRQK